MMGKYDAGYENCIDSMVRQMEDMQYRIDCLHRENAKLQASNEVIAEDHAALCEHNAKLRELVAHAWELFLKHGAVHPCDLPEVDAVRDEMRELGVEVDG